MFCFLWAVEGGLELVPQICLCLSVVNLPQDEMHMTSLCTLQCQLCLWEEKVCHDQREKLDKNYFHAEKILWVALSDHVYYV